MTYKLTVTTLALTAITSTVAATHAKPDTEHPHIVLILCDDMGFSDCKHSASCVFFSPLFLPTFVASL